MFHDWHVHGDLQRSVPAVKRMQATNGRCGAVGSPEQQGHRQGGHHASGRRPASLRRRATDTS